MTTVFPTTVLLTLFSLVLGGASASSQPAPSQPDVIFRSTFETVAPAVPFDLVMQVREFASGAWAPAHTHPAPTFITILEGEVTNVPIVDGQKLEPARYRAGDTFVEAAWAAHEVGNLGPVRAR